jgi:hypothetical protein
MELGLEAGVGLMARGCMNLRELARNNFTLSERKSETLVAEHTIDVKKFGDQELKTAIP